MIRTLFFGGVLFLVSCIFLPHAVFANSDMLGANNTKQSPAEFSADVEEGLNYLLTKAVHHDGSFDVTKITAVLRAAQGVYIPKKLPAPAKRDMGAGVFLQARFAQPLTDILRYTCDPNIPYAALSPSNVRLGYWKEGSDILTATPLWETPRLLTAPIVLHGVEFEEITPDSFSGSYYSYELGRLTVLMPWENTRVLIQVTRQLDKSAVGKKGAILGDDSNWNYIYSGEEGSTVSGVGWMDTYMYGSGAVSVFFENAYGANETEYAIFKWVRAGWAGMNVVRAKHIHAGTVRFLNSLKAFLSAPKRPSAELITQCKQYIYALTDEKQIALLNAYSKKVQELSVQDKIAKRDDFQRIIKDGNYAAHLSHEERSALLLKQFIKIQLEKALLAPVDFSGFTMQ